MIIAGERRWRAAREADVREVPCIEMDVDDRAVAEIALIENMQRKDLTPWEEADGLRALCDRFGYTHEEVARKVGKSRSAVTEALSISTLPDDIREKCRRAEITSKSLLLEIVRQPDDDSMREVAEEIISRGMTRDDARASRRAQSLRGKVAPSRVPYVYRYISQSRAFKLEIRFRRAMVEKTDILAALKDVLEKLTAEMADGSDNVGADVG
jgi:ParB family chromosome partitioning protein